ncbi:MAG: hypothetical protein V3T72_08780, partial [Thermoanaerobaculia bacterium]
VWRSDLSYDRTALTRYILHAVPLLVLLLALFGFAVELLDVEPPNGSVIRLALLEQPQVPAAVVFGTWLMEAAGLVALYLLARGRCGAWWLDGLVAGWTAWIFRGPLLVITIVIAAEQPQEPWWTLAFGWWVLYSICGLSLAVLARRQEARDEHPAELPREAEATAIEEPLPVSESEPRRAADDEGEGAQPEPHEAAAERDETPPAGDSVPQLIDPGAAEIVEER